MTQDPRVWQNACRSLRRGRNARSYAWGGDPCEESPLISRTTTEPPKSRTRKMIEMSMPESEPIERMSEWMDIALKAARAPAALIVEYFERGRIEKDYKRDGSPVTIADREAERIIRETLSASSPEPCDILGEEQGLSGSGTRLRWTVDPIDGTRSFVRGIPLFGTIIALEDTVTHRALVGVIHLPILHATFAAARSVGSTCNGQPIAVSSEISQADIVAAIGDPLQFSAAKCESAYQYLFEHVPCLRGYTDCFGHALVACGSIDMMMDPSLNPWDILATQVLIEEAGGRILLRPSAMRGKVDALFGNAALVEQFAPRLGF